MGYAAYRIAILLKYTIFFIFKVEELPGHFTLEINLKNLNISYVV